MVSLSLKICIRHKVQDLDPMSSTYVLILDEQIVKHAKCRLQVQVHYI